MDELEDMLMEHGIMKAVMSPRSARLPLNFRPLDPITTRVWPRGQTTFVTTSLGSYYRFVRRH